MATGQNPNRTPSHPNPTTKIGGAPTPKVGIPSVLTTHGHILSPELALPPWVSLAWRHSQSNAPDMRGRRKRSMPQKAPEKKKKRNVSCFIHTLMGNYSLFGSTPWVANFQLRKTALLILSTKPYPQKPDPPPFVLTGSTKTPPKKPLYLPFFSWDWKMAVKSFLFLLTGQAANSRATERRRLRIELAVLEALGSGVEMG